jgi:lysophospholipase L1-like esterase
MTHWNVALHNVSETETLADGGLVLHRYPKAVRRSLSVLGRMIAEDSAGVELRFVTESPCFRISLGSRPSFLSPYEQHGQEIAILRGAFVHSIHRLEPGRVNHIHVTNFSEGDPFLEFTGKETPHAGFSPNVWRIFLGRCANIFYGLETFDHPVRPPQKGETPDRRWLAYGSSITNGAAASLHLNSYVYHAARTAGLDVRNLGLSGSCRCESEVADFLGVQDDCSIFTLEVGVNMRGSVEPEDFRGRVERLLEKVHRADRKVFLITVYPNYASGDPDRRQKAYSEVLRDIHAGGRWPGLGLIEGGSVLDSPGDLTTDMIHPSDYGHARMGRNLGDILRGHLEPQ